MVPLLGGLDGPVGGTAGAVAVVGLERGSDAPAAIAHPRGARAVSGSRRRARSHDERDKERRTPAHQLRQRTRARVSLPTAAPSDPRRRSGPGGSPLALVLQLQQRLRWGGNSWQQEFEATQAAGTSASDSRDGDVTVQKLTTDKVTTLGAQRCYQ